MNTSPPVGLDSLPEVGRSLLINLLARAEESRRNHPVLVDREAVRIVDDLMMDNTFREIFDRIRLALDEFSCLSQVVRARCFDDEIAGFIARCPEATIVNIGAGLDTAFQRLDNGKMKWYDLDLPEVISLRRRLLPEGPRTTYIAKSAVDYTWLNDIAHGPSGLLLVSASVLFFLPETDVRELFSRLATSFPGAHLIFDTMSPLFLAIANRATLKRVGLGTEQPMRWAVRSPRRITRWNSLISVVDRYPMFSRVRLNRELSPSTSKRIQLANRLRGINMLHLEFSVTPPVEGT
jgi:O-methyltransferase involved in polyketide biosynthesis